MREAVPFEWSDRLATGVPEIDRQHVELMDLFRHLASLAAQGDRARVRAALEELIGRVCRHFDDEEQLMRRHRYADLPSHEQSHDMLLRQVQSFVALLDGSPDGDAGVDIIDFVGKWLVVHMQEDDRRLGAFLKAEAKACEMA
ncbi:MAG TPA: bacteriohemerythrin [Azospirillum sp.]|nr:bacteriohemerythrin [Azospirillum sp.]